MTISDPSLENPPVLISLLDDGATLAAFTEGGAADPEDFGTDEAALEAIGTWPWGMVGLEILLDLVA